jgi:hypothetical protein
MGEGTGRGEALSIWFFVGGLMLIYGLVLTPYGAWEWFGGHEAPTVLSNLHPTFWWGLGMTLFGLFYTLKFKPKSGDAEKV